MFSSLSSLAPTEYSSLSNLAFKRSIVGNLEMASLNSQIEVKALNFYSDENKGESILSGNVEVIRGDDILNSEKLIIYT
ncbi:LptA/OstA family protein, partial [Campylobacter jejuni]|uniref:LptA/OstA family protein n=1 Tax=Campylobacter jejuni TaxID=197 RepID=UPI002F26AF19